MVGHRSARRLIRYGDSSKEIPRKFKTVLGFVAPRMVLGPRLGKSADRFENPVPEAGRDSCRSVLVRQDRSSQVVFEDGRIWCPRSSEDLMACHTAVTGLNRRSGQQFRHDVAVHVRQAEVASLETERQLRVVKAQKLHDRGVQVMHMNAIGRGVEAEFI